MNAEVVISIILTLLFVIFYVYLLKIKHIDFKVAHREQVAELAAEAESIQNPNNDLQSLKANQQKESQQSDAGLMQQEKTEHPASLYSEAMTNTQSLVELDVDCPSDRLSSQVEKSRFRGNHTGSIGLSCFIGMLRHVTNLVSNTWNPKDYWEANVYDLDGKLLGLRCISPLHGNCANVDSYLKDWSLISTERILLLEEEDSIFADFFFDNGKAGVYQRRLTLVSDGFVEATLFNPAKEIIGYESYYANRGDYSSKTNWAHTLNYTEWDVLINDKDRNQIGYQIIRSTEDHCVIDTTYTNQSWLNRREHYRRYSSSAINRAGGHERYRNICKYRDSVYNEKIPQPTLQKGDLVIANDWDLTMQALLAKKNNSWH